jgi:hypothetical protein
MKSRITLLFAALFAITAWAGSIASDQLTVRLPEAIHAQSSLLPAGDYEIQVLDNPNGSAIVRITSAEGESVLVTATRVGYILDRTDGRTELVLARSKNGLQLQGIRISGKPYEYRIGDRH